ncbi:MAG: hypothetical protein HC796_12640 [Synechococcaceae cyanobacterium RL_1_2]|nr:hypothetical protein [Synechococcaceae cyanobacterium RL_1_2]
MLQAIPDRDTKTQAAQHLARIMAIDPYNARLQIPHRSWRLYRIGAIGELEFYSQQLRQAGIPCFTQTINRINNINVYEVKYLEQAGPTVKVRCTDDQGIQGAFQFKATEVSQRVEGLLPVFEEALQIDFTKRLQRYTRKTAILDYIRMGDLHLPDRQTILRFCDQNYDFHQGIPLGEGKQDPHQTNSLNWNNLLKLWSKLLPQVPLTNEFTPFGETAIEFSQSLATVKPKLQLHRRESSLWDNAWQLYSSLAFYQS